MADQPRANGPGDRVSAGHTGRGIGASVHHGRRAGRAGGAGAIPGPPGAGGGPACTGPAPRRWPEPRARLESGCGASRARPTKELPDMLAAIIVIVVIVLLIVFLISLYNGMVRARNKVDEAWSGIDVQLKRRHDLIPNLVETVKGYAAHERETFQAVTDARTKAMSASGPAQAGAAEGLLSQALGRLFAVAEAYPQLRATENFQQLQAELTNTEDQD